jgi:hypothetical protein
MHNETDLSIVEAASTDHSYLAAYYPYEEKFTKFKHNFTRAIAAIYSTLDSSIFIRYADHETPHALWAAIEHDFENQIRRTGLRQITAIAHDKYENHGSMVDWLAMQDRTFKDLLICGVLIPDIVRIQWIVDNLPSTPKWEGLITTLDVTGEIENLPKLKEHLITFETRIKKDDLANLVIKKEKKSLRSSNNNVNNNGNKRQQQRQQQYKIPPR